MILILLVEMAQYLPLPLAQLRLLHPGEELTVRTLDDKAIKRKETIAQSVDFEVLSERAYLMCLCMISI